MLLEDWSWRHYWINCIV